MTTQLYANDDRGNPVMVEGDRAMFQKNFVYYTGRLIKGNIAFL